MLDTLLYIFGPQLAERLFSSGSNQITSGDVVQAIRELAEEVQELRAQARRQRNWTYAFGTLAIFAIALAAYALNPGWFQAFLPKTLAP